MNTEAQVNGNQKSLVVKIVLVAAAIILVAFLFSLYNAGRTSARQNPSVVQGSVKMTEIDLNSMLDGYIDAVNVAEGDEVKAGDVILQIEPDIVQAKVKEAEAALGQAKAGLAQAQAAYQAAQAVLSKAQNGARPEDLAQAKAAYDYAAGTYERMKPLYEDGALTWPTEPRSIDGVYYAEPAEQGLVLRQFISGSVHADGMGDLVTAITWEDGQAVVLDQYFDWNPKFWELFDSSFA